MHLLARVGDIVAAASFAAGATPDKATIPILGNVLITAEDGTLSFTGTDLDSRAVSRASAQVAKPGTTTVDASKLADWLCRHDERAEVELSANPGKLSARIGSSHLVLPTLPAGDFPVPFDMEAKASVHLGEAEHHQLFRQTAPIIPATETRPALCGLSLRCADRKLIGLVSDGKRIVEVSIEASANLPEFSIIIPRDVVLAVVKMKGDITLGVGKRFVGVGNGNGNLISKLIDAIFPEHRRAIPPPSGNSIEVDRAALSDSLELVRAAIGKPADSKKAQLPFAFLTWTDSAGEVVIAAGDPKIGETTIPAITRGNAHVAVPIRQILPLLDAIDAERISLDSAAPASPLLITKAAGDGFVALQSLVRP